MTRSNTCSLIDLPVMIGPSVGFTVLGIVGPAVVGGAGVVCCQ